MSIGGRELSSIPTSTYRLQLTADFTLFDAAALVPYLADLGVSHVYCSPWLQAAAGSGHGYDVVDHSRVDADRGGPEGVRALAAACAEHGLGIVLDLVPNHMSVAAPEDANAAWTDVLTTGQDSEHAGWFDIDWAAGLHLPIRGDDGEIGPEHVLPEPGAWTAVPWREGPSYRRFFDVDSLAGLRVEDQEIFDATHALVVEQVRAGLVQGLRIDHPDGLADPARYVEQLAEAVPGTWTVIEKILEHGEELPAAWPCEGTTGYDAVLEVSQLFLDPAGRAPLEQLAFDLTGVRPDWEAEAARGKRFVASTIFAPELRRLTALAAPQLGHDEAVVSEALLELLVGCPTYRDYDRDASAAAALVHPSLRAVADDLLPLLRAPGELGTRFQQTSGPVMAKGVEDTACYRHATLLALNEVGGDPGRFGSSLTEWHAWCARAQELHPLGLTTSSTHDTKRSADVRSRLQLLSELPWTWTPLAGELTAAAMELGLDAHASYLTAQTLFGAWPISGERLAGWLTKATKEAKLLTSWRDPDPAYDELVVRVARELPERVGHLAQLWVDEHAEADGLASLASTLVTLLMPGVPDVYQGTETVDRSLVDPDNRRPVDWPRLAAGGEAKQVLVRTALRLRRVEADAVRGAYEPLELDDDRFVGWVRGGRIGVIAPRRPGAVAGEPAPLFPGAWRQLLDHPSLSLLVRED